MDPYTGEIYAEATYPSYDANDYKAIAASDPSRFIDPVVSSVYEPGSVFKMMTAAAALDQGHRHPDDQDQGHRDAPPRQGQDQDRRRRPQGHGLDDVRGRRRLFAQRRRGEGRARPRQDDPGIVRDPLRHVDAARLRQPDRHRRRRRGRRASSATPGIKAWRQIDLANGAFGQGVAVTPIQLATAYAALVNGGTLVQPHVVQGGRRPRGRRRAARARTSSTRASRRRWSA